MDAPVDGSNAEQAFGRNIRGYLIGATEATGLEGVR